VLLLLFFSLHSRCLFWNAAHCRKVLKNRLDVCNPFLFLFLFLSQNINLSLTTMPISRARLLLFARSPVVT